MANVKRGYDDVLSPINPKFSDIPTSSFILALFKKPHLLSYTQGPKGYEAAPFALEI